MAWVGSGPDLVRGRGACRDRTVTAGCGVQEGGHVIGLLCQGPTSAIRDCGIQNTEYRIQNTCVLVLCNIRSEC